MTRPIDPGRLSRRRRLRLRRGDRGATLVEGALAAPLFFLLIFSIIEFSMVFRQYLTVTSAVRAAARAASTGGNDGNADYLTLKEISRSSPAIQTSEIEFIVIYKAATVESTPENDATLAGCLTGPVVDKCNWYLPSALSLSATSFGCGGSDPDRYWCPMDRLVSLTDPPDHIGVLMRTKYNAITGVFGKNYTFNEEAVFRMEPRQR